MNKDIIIMTTRAIMRLISRAALSAETAMDHARMCSDDHEAYHRIAMDLEMAVDALRRAENVCIDLAANTIGPQK